MHHQVGFVCVSVYVFLDSVSDTIIHPGPQPETWSSGKL